MSRTRKSKNYLAGPKSIYKAYRVRKERARLREALGTMKVETDVEDNCGSTVGCPHCGVHYADDAGPKHELAHFDHWAYD